MMFLRIFIFCSLFVFEIEDEALSNAMEPQNLLVTLPGGSYTPLFGKDVKKNGANIPVKVSVVTFQLQKFPVTNYEYLRFLQSHRDWRRSRISRLFAGPEYLKHWKLDNLFSDSMKSSPVVFVSWFAAKAYCKSLDLRLPTTDEWEYAASFPLVRKGIPLSEKAKNQLVLEWYSIPSSDKLPPDVGKTKNNKGIYDLFSLVWEWTYDFNSVLLSQDNRSNSNAKNGLFCGGGVCW